MTKALRTRGQLEAEVAAALTQFERDHMGRGPRGARAHLVADMVVVRLAGILSPAEQALSLEAGGVDLIKQVRSRMIEAAQETLWSLVQAAAGVKVVSMHTDLSTRSGERVFVFVLEQEPEVRQGL